MNYTKKTQITLINKHYKVKHGLFGLLAFMTISSILSCSNSNQLLADPVIDPHRHQAVFATPEDAANTFALAVKDNNQALFDKLLGEDFREILPLDDVTPEDLNNFNAGWENHHTLLPQGDKKRLLAIGKGEWTLPIPITEGQTGWYFDVTEGLERMRIRRIGRNELATMQAVLAYYDAQIEYAEQDRDNNNILEYAQKFISTPGLNDGLYWETEPGELPSPLGPLLADRSPDGGYHGYYYQILKAQGDNAKKGAYSYMIGNHMRAGFALIAWPKEYGESGIMSFMVSHDGIVYQQDLGPDSAIIAEKISVYDPGEGWIPAQEVNDPMGK